MGFHLRMGAWRVALGCVLSLPGHAADVGGWYADQQKASAQAPAKTSDDACPQVIVRAAAEETTALAAYRAALCYLQGEAADVVAAKAWLTRSAEAGFMPARRVLRSLLIVEAGAHSATPHCHVLGEGQQICHGGAARLPVAATATN